MVLEWTPEEASLLQDQPFSAAASVYISTEAWETQNHQTFFQHQSTGYPRTRGQERLVLVSFTTATLFHYMRRSTIDPSPLHLKRASKPPDNFLLGIPSIKGQGTS